MRRRASAWRRRRSACRCGSSSSTCRSAAIRPRSSRWSIPSSSSATGMQLEEEGCLSVPGLQRHRARPPRAVVKGWTARARAHHRRRRAAGARAAARDGSPRRVSVRRSPPRHQARSDRPQDQEAGPRRQVVDGRTCASSSSARRRSRSRRSGAARFAHQVVGVVTQPDRPRGRGQRVTGGPVKALALEAACRSQQPEGCSDEAMADVRGIEADIGVVAAYGKILPEWLLRDSAARSHQRACVAPAEVPRRVADSSRRDERRCRRPG